MWSQNNTLTQTQLTAKIGAVLFCQYLTAPKHLHWALVWESMWWLNSGGVSLYLLNLYFSAKPNRSQAGSELSSMDTPVSALSNFYTQQDFTNWQNCRKCKGPCKYMEWKLQILENCVTMRLRSRSRPSSNGFLVLWCKSIFRYPNDREI